MRRLIIRPGAIGDCLLGLPAIEFLQTERTEIWVPASLCSLLRRAETPAESGPEHVRSISSTGLDRFGLGDGFMPPGLRETLQGFDDIVSWYGENRSEFREAALRLNPHWRFLRALPPGDCTLHAADYFLSQVGGEVGASPRLHFSHTRHGAIAIHPFSGNVIKNWPLSSYRELAMRLAAADGITGEVAMLAGPEEELPEARRFEDLVRLASWLSGAALYIGNDSGPTHLAAAVGVSTLALFGPSNPAIWAPRGPRVSVLQREPISELSVDEVLRAAQRALKSGQDGADAATHI
jgi:heptosyltransferase III